MFNLSCSICSELYAQSDEIFTTGCGHIFHNLCLQKWLAQSNTCPQCRKTSTVGSIHRIYINPCNATSNVDQNTVQELLQNANLAMTQKEAECEKIKKQMNYLKSKHLKDLAKEKKVSSEKNQKLTEQLRVATKDVNNVTMKEMAYKSTIAELTQDLKNLKCSQAQLQAVWSKSKIASQKELKMKTDTVTRLTEKLEEVESVCQETRNKHVMSLQNIEVLTDELEDAKSDANEFKLQLEHLKNDKQLMHNELTKAHKELKMKTDTVTRLIVKLKEAEDTVSHLTVKLEEQVDNAANLFGQLMVVELVHRKNLEFLDTRTNELLNAKFEADMYRERWLTEIREHEPKKVVFLTIGTGFVILCSIGLIFKFGMENFTR